VERLPGKHGAPVVPEPASAKEKSPRVNPRGLFANRPKPAEDQCSEPIICLMRPQAVASMGTAQGSGQSPVMVPSQTFSPFLTRMTGSTPGTGATEV